MVVSQSGKSAGGVTAKSGRLSEFGSNISQEEVRTNRHNEKGAYGEISNGETS